MSFLRDNLTARWRYLPISADKRINLHFSGLIHADLYPGRINFVFVNSALGAVTQGR
jgi:hypothetical protein